MSLYLSKFFGLPLGAWRRLRSRCLTAKATERAIGSQIVVEDPLLPVTIEMAKGSSFILRGRLTLNSWFGNRQRIYIKVGKGGTLIIDGDFGLGSGCRLIVEPDAQLYIGGCKRESGCGLTENGLIMVRRRLVIGKDLLCAWGAYITDCDWHGVAGVSGTEDTIIGNHVWITPNCTVLKGSRIGDGCILATGTVTHKSDYPERSLIGGIPARVLAENREWMRDMKPLSSPQVDPNLKAKSLA